MMLRYGIWFVMGLLLIGLLAGGGVLFVNTRDDRYAKIEFYPDAFFMESAPDILRDLSLRYVYDPDGSRDLRFQEAGQME